MGNSSGEASQLLIINASHTEGWLSLQLKEKHAPLSSILDSVYHTTSQYRERANNTQSQSSNWIWVDPVASNTTGEKLPEGRRDMWSMGQKAWDLGNTLGKIYILLKDSIQESSGRKLVQET